jgi:hypothetical protein
MRLKKIVALGVILGAVSLPLVANADLVIANNTNDWSSVKIKGRCTGPVFATAPHQAPTYPQKLVFKLCGSVSGTCTAEVYASRACDGSTFVGTADVNTDSDVVSNVTVSNNHYSIVPEGTKVSINFLG